MPNTLLVQHDGAVCTIAFNNPSRRNAVDVKMMLALRKAVMSLDEGTRVIVLTGTGGAFSSGADLSVMMRQEPTPDSVARTLTDAYHPAILALREAPCPVIAAVDGVAAGIGCDIALACDIRLVSDRARFAELFVQVGLVPDGGGTFNLPRIIGLGRALELFYTGAQVPADEALAIGLANKVFPSDTFAADVAAYTGKIATQAPHALRRIRKAVYEGLDGTFAEALWREATYQREIFASEDGFEGFRAFLEKRPPVWR